VSNWEPVARRGALIVGQARAFGGVKTGTEMVDGMNKSTSHSASYRPLLLVAICILVLGGFGFLYCALVGESHGLKAWLLPLGPWFCAFLAYRGRRDSKA
jgi:hypothetical protein